MRLLSFLELVETALRADGQDLTASQVSRQVNYEAGLARMQLPEGVSLVVQNFNLSDGKLCLKTWWVDAQDNQVGLQSFFDANGGDWKAAARQVAAVKPADPLAEVSLGDDSAAAELDAGLGGFRSAV